MPQVFLTINYKYSCYPYKGAVLRLSLYFSVHVFWPSHCACVQSAMQCFIYKVKQNVSHFGPVVYILLFGLASDS